MLYTGHSGDTLSGIASRFGVAVGELAQANGIEDPDLIFPGQSPDVPGVRGESAYPAAWPAPGTTDEDCPEPVDSPACGDPEARHPATHDDVINRFAVETNPRYRPRGHDTYCNVFVWDVTRAMGAEIPHLIGQSGEPVSVYRGTCLSANGMDSWLDEDGPRYGWREVSPEEAQRLANLGHPAVASLRNEAVTDPWHAEAVGHVAIVRPGAFLNGPAIVQAGIYNFNHAHVYYCFPYEGIRFYVNDAGAGVEQAGVLDPPREAPSPGEEWPSGGGG